jgi:hypothetical protein
MKWMRDDGLTVQNVYIYLREIERGTSVKLSTLSYLADGLKQRAQYINQRILSGVYTTL